MGAWIETNISGERPEIKPSHPVWVRGLKPPSGIRQAENAVAPRVGAWIETDLIVIHCSATRVAPRVGAWIETAGNFRVDLRG